LIWLGIGTYDRLLWTWLWSFTFHKMQGISWPTKEMLSSQKGMFCWGS
jgi:hypothetical protein